MTEQFKRELNKTYLILGNDDTDYEESYEIEMILKNMPQTLLPLHVLRVNGRLELYYDVSSKQSLRDCVGRSKFSADIIRSLFERIDQLIAETKDYLLDMDSILLDLEHIYRRGENFYFCYCPWEKREVLNSFRVMLEEILGELDYHDTEGVELAYHLYQSACKGDFSISEILKEHSEAEDKILRDDYGAYFGGNEELQEEFLQEPEEVISKNTRIKGIFRRILKFFLKKEKIETVTEEYSVNKDGNRGFFVEEESFYAPQSMNEDAYTTMLGEMQGECWRLRPLLPEYEEFCITEESFLVGKKRESVDGYIGRDTISRIHSRLLIRQERLYITDMNSTNGTFVNGNSVEPGKEVEIFQGDRILFADVGYECYNSL